MAKKKGVDKASQAKRDLFYRQLQKHGNWALLRMFGSIASIIALIVALVSFKSIEISSDYFAIFVCLTVIVLLTIIVKYKIDKRYLYTEILPHIHFVNHACRDFMADENSHNPDALNLLLTQCVTAISETFSIVHR